MHREYFPGVGEAVADRTINRPGENWGDVARRVAEGNSALDFGRDREELEKAIASAQILMSGRHLQHGDASQPERNMEVFTNCSTASQRALVFYLLLNGSGVGTSYDDDMCVVNWDLMPKVVPVLDRGHADFTGEFPGSARGDFYFVVPDSREGWAEAVQFVEDLTYQAIHAHKMVVLDFSNVRPKGSPIGGMQSRPSSGPIPLMQALVRMNEIRGARLPMWLQAMKIDHLLAEIVLVGGARRAARIACKWWGDQDIMEFINCKRSGDLWTANNSVGVDADFWKQDTKAKRAVFDACVEAQYRHGTGEPAFLNLDLLSVGETVDPNPDELSGNFHMTSTAAKLRAELMVRASKKRYPVIVNPCGEIRLSINGGYCVIADVVPAFCETQEEFNQAVALASRALIRTNLMPALYQGEVRRTNRIGVALTGIHEYAWKRFGLTFKDLVEEGDVEIRDANGRPLMAPSTKAWPFWASLAEAALECEVSVIDYCAELEVVVPLTRRTIKPAGTTSKLFGLTEGAHLPAMREYLRWVQFQNSDPLIAEYAAKGYPTRVLETYKNVTIVGFPTRLELTELMGEQVVTAAEATFEEQIRWIRLLETYWLLEMGGNQISYTLKYDPKVTSMDDYRAAVLEFVPTVRAVSVMPQTDATAYEYQPEEPITPAQYLELVSRITVANEDIGLEHVDCASGACPIDFRAA